jgi:Protein of unknown function (DUF732)
MSRALLAGLEMRTIGAALAHKLRAHACRFMSLPEITIESAAVDDAQTEQWSSESYEDDLELERKYPPRPLALIAFLALLLIAGLVSAAVVKADPNADDQQFLHDLHNSGLVLIPGAETIAIDEAHYVCSAAWRGEATDDIAAEIDAVEPKLKLPQAQTIVAIALRVYCPNIGARS